jgi:uncharacterized protein YbbK (DUF523 family)
MQKILISSCLLGARVRYHGGDALVEHPALLRWAEEGRLVPLCPEVAAGLPTPRPAAELRPRADSTNVVIADGTDVTSFYIRGAQTAVDVARREEIHIAILKNGSPSCGSSLVYDGTFSGRQTEGAGVTASLLMSRGVRVFSESEIDKAAAYLEQLEATT